MQAVKGNQAKQSMLPASPSCCAILPTGVKCVGRSVQDIVDAVADNNTDHTQSARTFYTPDVSPSKQPADASKGTTTVRKKQHSTPPIKDVRSSSLCGPACCMPVYKAFELHAAYK